MESLLEVARRWFLQLAGVLERQCAPQLCCTRALTLHCVLQEHLVRGVAGKLAAGSKDAKDDGDGQHDQAQNHCHPALLPLIICPPWSWPFSNEDPPSSGGAGCAGCVGCHDGNQSAGWAAGE